jgi:predicted small lipoprotein YifL
MTLPTPRKLLAFLVLASLITLAGCGDGNKPAAQSTPAPAAKSEAKSSGAVSETEHQKFEKKYAELCVKGQQSNPDSPVQGDQALGGMCECMAKEVSKRLSKAEAVHFLDKKEMPIELVMMGNAASDICAQPKK